MRRETQADHLAKIVKEYTHISTYELIFPLVKVKKERLIDLSEEDVWVLPMQTLEMLLLQEKRVVAHVKVAKEANTYVLEVVRCVDKPMELLTDKTFESVMLSLGELNYSHVTVNDKLPFSKNHFKTVYLKQDDKLLAEAELVRVEEHIALKIKKVIR